VGSTFIVVTQELVREFAFLVAVTEDVGPQSSSKFALVFLHFFAVEFARKNWRESVRRRSQIVQITRWIPEVCRRTLTYADVC
jgi:hypothetical protein